MNISRRNLDKSVELEKLINIFIKLLIVVININMNLRL